MVSPFRAIFTLFITLLISTTALPQGTPKKNQKVYLAFIQDDQTGREDFWAPGLAGKRAIKPAFERDALEWKAISTLPIKLDWTVAFDGRGLGQIRSAPDPDKPGLQRILTASTLVPTVGQPSKSFAGLLGDGPGKVRRPLVAISKPNFTDPDHWKRSVLAAVRANFRREFPKVKTSTDEQNPIIQDRKYKNSDLQVTRAYGSNRGSFLVETDLKLGDCDEYIDDRNDPFADQWFYVSKDLTFRRLGGFLELLDAGDYDGDGKSEVIFFLTQPGDTDGYVLFYDDFKKQVENTWTYH